ncbi:MAG: calcium/proton exchanger [Armatimonadota bacterium]
MAASMSSVSRKDWIILVAATVATVVAGLAHGRTSEIVSFILAALALSLLAVVVGEATEHLGSRLSPGATGVLHSALGNLPELMVCIFSLRAGLVDVVKGALIGSILANSVLVLGLAIMAGGLKHGLLKFRTEPPRMMAVLMLLACTALAVPTLADSIHTPASAHEEPLSLVCSIVLLVVYFCSLKFFISGDKEVTPAPDPEEQHASWPLWFAITVLAIAGVGSGLVSDWFVEALKPATAAMGLSEAFTGLVVVAIAGNAIENLVGIQLAMKNKPELAISVILNSSLQIALMLIPILVIASFFIASTPLTLVLPPMLLAVMLFSAIVPAFVVFDGEAIWLEGAALIGLYVLFAAAFWWG